MPDLIHTESTHPVNRLLNSKNINLEAADFQLELDLSQLELWPLVLQRLQLDRASPRVPKSIIKKLNFCQNKLKFKILPLSVEQLPRSNRPLDRRHRYRLVRLRQNRHFRRPKKNKK